MTTTKGTATIDAITLTDTRLSLSLLCDDGRIRWKNYNFTTPAAKSYLEKDMAAFSITFTDVSELEEKASVLQGIEVSYSAVNNGKGESVYIQKMKDAEDTAGTKAAAPEADRLASMDRKLDQILSLVQEFQPK